MVLLNHLVMYSVFISRMSKGTGLYPTRDFAVLETMEEAALDTVRTLPALRGEDSSSEWTSFSILIGFPGLL
jgi:hypothetical protein